MGYGLWGYSWVIGLFYGLWGYFVGYRVIL